MSRKIIGLDIRRHSINGVMVRAGVKGSWFEKAARVSLPQPPGDEAARIEAIEGALQETIAQLGGADALCVVSLPPDLASYRNIRLPFKDAKKIRQILPFELEPSLPFPVDELIIDFRAIQLPSQAEGTDIIAAAIEKKQILFYMDRLQKAKLDPEILTVGGFATAQALCRMTDIPENGLFIDIDTDRCTIFALISGQISLVRVFPLNPGHGEKEIAKNLCGHIRRTLAAFEQNFHPDYQPEEIHLAGYGLSDTEFDAEIQRILGVPVKRFDLIRDSGMLRKQRGGGGAAPMPDVDHALALAITDVHSYPVLNFRKGEFGTNRQWAEHKSSLIKLGILGLLVMGGFFANFLIEAGAMERQIDEIDGKIRNVFQDTFPEITRIVDPLHQMQVAMEEESEESRYAADPAADIKAIDILNEISRGVPPGIDVELNRMVIGDNSVLVSGDTDTFNAVDEIQNGLSGSTLFKKVTISSTNKERTGNRIQFKMRIEL